MQILAHSSTSHVVELDCEAITAGSGQAAAEIAKRYSTVIAQDPSAEQLSAAEPQGANITFEVASAEATGQPDASFDLVTVAIALHWCVPFPNGHYCTDTSMLELVNY